MNRKSKDRRIELPEFWLDYEQKFKIKSDTDIDKVNFVVFDTETTGFDFEQDRILSIGAVKVKNNEISISDSLELEIYQDWFNASTVPIHGRIKHERMQIISESDAILSFLEYIGSSILVAHRANFDVTMINRALNRMGLPNLKNRVLDTVHLYAATRIKSSFIHIDTSLDAIAEHFDLDVTDRHTAAGDAFLTAMVFLKTLSRLNSDKKIKLKDLFKIK